MNRRRVVRTACAAAWLHSLAACVQSPPRSAATLYERLGGRAAIAALIADAVGHIAADPRINRRFGAIDPDHLGTHLTDLVCERSGGPCVYRGRNMADAHEGLEIRDDEFDALIEDVAQAFDAFKVAPAERSEALAMLRQMRGAIVGH